MPNTIVIIANGYRGHRDFQELLGVDADATAVEAIFRFRLSNYTVFTLRDRSKERILEAVRDAAAGVDPGQNLVIYFAGHAVEVKGEHVLICNEATEANLDLFEGAVSVKLLRRATKRPGIHRKFILDCCRTLAPIKGRRGASSGLTGLARLRDIVASMVDADAGDEPRSPFGMLLGCGEGEAAPEIPGSQGGLFTQTLVQLIDESANAGRAIAIDLAFVERLERSMQARAKSLGISAAEPQLVAGGQPFVLTPNRMVATPVPLPPSAPAPTQPSVQANPPADTRSGAVGTPFGGPLRWVALVIVALGLIWFGMVLNAGRGSDQQSISADRSAPLEVALPGGATMRFAHIAPGEFLMGSPSGEEGRDADEGPQHKVRLTKGFAMGVTEVTQAQWESVMGTNPSRFKGPTLPVEQVTWFDAVEYCNRLTEWVNQNGGPYRKPYYAIDGERVTAGVGTGFRLPTEAEWEYACRAGTTTPFHFGSTISTKQAHYYPDESVPWEKRTGKTKPVGSFPANAWGLHDMHGNVYEWCWDWYGEKEYATRSSSSVTPDPTGPSSGGARVVRGGSWVSDPWDLRSAYRGRGSPAGRGDDIGFRLCLDSG
jgi:sulfatase modifying factor 1